LDQAQEQLYRFGRGYPAGWDGAGIIRSGHSRICRRWRTTGAPGGAEVIVAESAGRSMHAILTTTARARSVGEPLQAIHPSPDGAHLATGGRFARGRTARPVRRR
ncbi:MAG TPA: hypothetical protein VIP10_10355, partial [Burkholderiaceae bacterium]